MSVQRVYRAVHGYQWFPHVPLALLLALGSIWLLRADVGTDLSRYVQLLLFGGLRTEPRLFPPLLISGGMLTMALGLLLRSRLAWVMALMLAITASLSTMFGVHERQDHQLLAYYVFVFAAMLASWRQFDRSSVAASTLFAVTSVAMLITYATFGSYYMGEDFKPHITDLVTAFYYAMVTMTTVGYGDITPQTQDAKLFAVSVIVLGVAVFATSLTAVISPMINRSLQRIVNRRGSDMKRENHFVVVGNTSLAVNTWHELTRRGRPVTRILRKAPEDGELKGVDLVVGDPSNADVLREAGAHLADAVLAMLVDDSENAFVVLAVKELGGSARTVAAVNDAQHLSRVKLSQPDVIIAPQVLGGELTAMLMTGEQVTPEFVMHSVFQQTNDATSKAPR